MPISGHIERRELLEFTEVTVPGDLGRDLVEIGIVTSSEDQGVGLVPGGGVLVSQGTRLAEL